MYSMAGIIKRKNKWVAICRTLDGREIRRTTGIDVVPKALMPGVQRYYTNGWGTYIRNLCNNLDELEQDITDFVPYSVRN